MEEEKKKESGASGAGDESGACGKIMGLIDNMIRQHGVHVVAMAALAVLGLHLYQRYGKPQN